MGCIKTNEPSCICRAWKFCWKPVFYRFKVVFAYPGYAGDVVKGLSPRFPGLFQPCSDGLDTAVFSLSRGLPQIFVFFSGDHFRMSRYSCERWAISESGAILTTSLKCLTADFRSPFFITA